MAWFISTYVIRNIHFVFILLLICIFTLNFNDDQKYPQTVKRGASEIWSHSVSLFDKIFTLRDRNVYPKKIKKEKHHHCLKRENTFLLILRSYHPSLPCINSFFMFVFFITVCFEHQTLTEGNGVCHNVELFSSFQNDVSWVRDAEIEALTVYHLETSSSLYTWQLLSLQSVIQCMIMHLLSYDSCCINFIFLFWVTLSWFTFLSLTSFSLSVLSFRPAGGRSSWTATACDIFSFYLTGASAVMTIKVLLSFSLLMLQVLSLWSFANIFFVYIQ